MAATKSQRELIERLFKDIPDLESGWSNHKVLLANKVEAEERDHRRLQRGAKWGASVDLATKLFVIQLLHSFCGGKKLPTLTDVLRWKASNYYAAAISQEFSEQLKAWSESVPEEITELDYVDLVA